MDGRSRCSVTCSLEDVEGAQDVTSPCVRSVPPHKCLIPLLDKTSSYYSILGPLWPDSTLAATAFGSQWQAEMTAKERLKQWSKWEDFGPGEAENITVPSRGHAYSVVSDSLRPSGPQLARLLCSWDFPGKNTGVSGHLLSRGSSSPRGRTHISCTGRRFLHHWATWEALYPG